jgi:hypothetical protein
VGPRWCGGWRRANLQRPHDQDQIQAEGYYPRTAEDDQAQIIEAAGARWYGFGAPSRTRACTKNAQVVALLQDRAGTTIAAIMTATGW